MNEQTKISFTLRVLFAIAMLGLALAFMRVSADMLNALILAWIIVLVASPLLRWLRSKGVPHLAGVRFNSGRDPGGVPHAYSVHDHRCE